MSITRILFRRIESFQTHLIGALLLLVLSPASGIASTIIRSDVIFIYTSSTGSNQE